MNGHRNIFTLTHVQTSESYQLKRRGLERSQLAQRPPV